MNKLAPAIALLGGLLLLFSGSGGGSPDPFTPDSSPAANLLQQCATAEIAAKLQLLTEMSGMTWPGDTPGERAIPASDWWLEQSAEKRIEAQIPFTDALAEAINSETVADFVGAK